MPCTPKSNTRNHIFMYTLRTPWYWPRVCCYARPGTVLEYAATHSLVLRSCMLLRVPVTDPAYLALRCPVLT
eukprot:539858-Rhodomonas_salina.1